MQVHPVHTSPCGAASRRPALWIPRALVALVALTLVIGLTACGGGSGGGTVILPPDDGGGMGDVDPVLLALITDRWSNSGHNDEASEPFRHWDDTGVIPASCARCHSTPGFRDYIGDDGSAIDSTEASVPVGTTVNCDACHNDTAITLSHVVFPSGAIATDLGAEARCMTCHQGRESTVSMNTHIAGAGIVDDDTPDSDLRFRNVHYFAAGATLYGGLAKGAYQYTNPGADMIVGTFDDELKYGYYDTRNPHVKQMDTCIECHDQHTLERRIPKCAECHSGVTSDIDLRNIRMAGSVQDYDGDGSKTEGIYYEIKGLEVILLAALKTYAKDVLANPIGYDANAYPYFFGDTNENGILDTGESGYGGWSARLLRAAYNYQYAQKDPGAFAHNPKYVIEFLYDSIADLNAHPAVTVPNFTALHRNDEGHFDAGAEAFRHWDQPADQIEPGSIDQGEVSTSCARCHSPGGFDFWATYGIDITIPQPVGDGFRCEQCHVEGADFAGTPEVKYIPSVEFPSGVIVNNDPGNKDPSFLCISCHKGRESGATVDANIASRALQGRDPQFRNIHYLAAGATMWGADGAVGYQYPAKMYKGKWLHQGEPPINGSSETARCTYCHLEDHSFKPQLAQFCKNCHVNTDIEDVRISRGTDYDGDGNNTEQLKEEVATFAARLLAAMQDYESTIHGGSFTVLPGYPYYSITKWDAVLARSVFNYQFWAKEPGAWAHNTHYILQLLYDSIEDVETAMGKPGEYTGDAGAYADILTRP